MKKITILMVLFVCLSLALPVPSEARRYYYGGCCGGGCGNYWVPAAIVAGTLVAGALFIGAMNQASRPPQQPAYRPIDTRTPYASPDPDFVARYGQPSTPSPQTAGEWIIVPAQQVGGKWVPAHRIFVPNS